MTEGMVLHAADGSIFDCNEQATRILGLTRNQILGKSSRDPNWRAVREDGSHFPGEEHPAMIALKNGRPCRQVVMGLQLPAGRRRWLNINAEPLFRANDSKPIGVVVTFADITDRKQAMEAKLRSEARFRAIAEFSPDIITLFDREGRVVFNSAAADKIHGYKAGELEKRPTFELIHPEDRDGVVTAFGRLLNKQEQLVKIQYRYRNADGSYKWMEAFAHNELANPHINSIIAISRDITERKLAMEALRNSEEQYRALFANMQNGFAHCQMIYSRAGRAVDFIYLQVNPAFIRLTGLKNVVGRRVTEVIPGIRQAHPELFEIYGRVTRTGQPEQLEVELKPLALWLQINVYRPQTGHFAAIFENITRRKLAEAVLRLSRDNLERRVLERTAELNRLNLALRKSEERFRSIAANTPDHIIIQDRNLRYQTVINPHLGFTEAQMIGKTERDLFSKKEAELLQGIKKKILKTGQPVHMEMPFRNRQGALDYFEGDYIPKRDTTGRVDGVIGYFRNITKRKQMEMMLTEKEAFLRKIYNHIGAAIFVINIHAAGKYTYAGWNFLGETITGIKSEKALGRTPQEIFAPAVAERICANYDRCVREGTLTYEESFPKGRKVIWSQTTLVTVTDETGQAKTIVGFGSDITERKRITEALSESEERYRMLFTNSQDAMITSEMPAWNTTSVNPAALKMFRARNIKQLLAVKPWQLSPKYQTNRLTSKLAAQTMIKKAMDEGSSIFNWRHRRLDGEEFPALVQLTRIEVGRKVLLHGTVRDITEQKRLEHEILKISDWERRRIAQDLHDGLGQILVGATYLTDSLKIDIDKPSGPASQRLHRLQEVLQSAIHQARNLARGVEPVVPEPNGLATALKNLAQQTQAWFGGSCVFRGRPEIHLDDHLTATHLFRMAQESVTNAIKHGKAKRIAIHLTQNGRRFTLAVEDNGLGLADWRKNQPGMGVRIMRYRAGLIGGELTVKNNTAGGATVICTVELKAAGK